MKSFLLYRARDIDLLKKLPLNEKALMQDLGLGVILEAMVGGKDAFLADIASRVVFNEHLTDPDDIIYRQAILQDCMSNHELVDQLYALAVEPFEKQKGMFWGFLTNYPGRVLSESVRMLEMLVVVLRKLRTFSEQHVDRFQSEGFKRFFSMIIDELNEAYFAEIEDHLVRLKFNDGVLLSANLGRAVKGKDYVLRRQKYARWSRIREMFDPRQPSYTFHLHPRDEAGAQALGELRDRGTALVAEAVGQSASHVMSFFQMFRAELAFYMCCLNLQKRLGEKGVQICLPAPSPCDDRRLACKNLRDPSLALSATMKIIGSDVEGSGKDLIVITGANQGGKSTFLRGLGLAQIMMQAGMFVAAERFEANTCDQVFTHYKREEDTTMRSGKFDEELGRLSAIVDKLTPNSLLLFNEPFAATNEREGAEIGRQVLAAFIEKKIKVAIVTHLYDLAGPLYAQHRDDSLFLRAERESDGHRTFKVSAGEPLETSFGQDLYQQIFKAPHAESNHPGLDRAQI